MGCQDQGYFTDLFRRACQDRERQDGERQDRERQDRERRSGQISWKMLGGVKHPAHFVS